MEPVTPMHQTGGLERNTWTTISRASRSQTNIADRIRFGGRLGGTIQKDKTLFY